MNRQEAIARAIAAEAPLLPASTIEKRAAAVERALCLWEDERRRELVGMVEKLRRQHLYCEDCWYSCPLSAEGCCNDASGPDCNCGAAQHNEAVDAVLGVLRGETK